MTESRQDILNKSNPNKYAMDNSVKTTWILRGLFVRCGSSEKFSLICTQIKGRIFPCFASFLFLFQLRFCFDMIVWCLGPVLVFVSSLIGRCAYELYSEPDPVRGSQDISIC